jgi:UPF0755 protein
MKVFGRSDRRPDAMEWGSSFAEAELSSRRRRWGRSERVAYDAGVMAAPHGDSQRPIGARHRDVPLPEDLTVAPDPRRPHGVGRRIASVLLLAAALAFIGGLAWLAVSYTGSIGGEQVADGTPVEVVIPEGANSDRIAAILEDAGVVRNGTVFRARLRLSGDGSQFRAGTYTLETGASYDTIVRVLEEGPAAAPTFDITIPEGQRIEETAAHIDSLRSAAQREGRQVLPAFTGAEYLQALTAQRLPQDLGIPAGTRSREGLLFPATYQLRLDATAEDFVERQRQAFADNMAAIDMTRATEANLTKYDIVIIASLIEREARLAKERPLVAAVIWNRLRIGEPLGIDASNQYDVYEPGSDEFWVRELRQSHLARESPYNLRKVQGLPPTPIAAPSASSLQAAANPADVDYRYYVANPDGSGEHFFTESYDEFLRHPFQRG